MPPISRATTIACLGHAHKKLKLIRLRFRLPAEQAAKI